VHAKAGLNREILASGWGILVKRLKDKAPGRVEKINPAYTSKHCPACGHVASDNRKSQSHSSPPGRPTGLGVQAPVSPALFG
jgi:transposase